MWLPRGRTAVILRRRWLFWLAWLLAGLGVAFWLQASRLHLAAEPALDAAATLAAGVGLALVLLLGAWLASGLFVLVHSDGEEDGVEPTAFGTVVFVTIAVVAFALGAVSAVR